VINSKKLLLADENYFDKSTNFQLTTVKVKKTKNTGRLHFLPWKPYSTRRQRGRAEYRDSENFKAVPRIFYGAKIAPLPLPALFPRAARGGALRRSPTRSWGIVKSAVCLC
jgi:hypothetical protein